MNIPRKPKSVDINKQYRQIEKSINLTVISADPTDICCTACGQKRMRFQCHLFRESLIAALCKDCAIERAGGEAKVWVRTEIVLRRKWKDQKRPAQPKQLVGARTRQFLTDISRTPLPGGS